MREITSIFNTIRSGNTERKKRKKKLRQRERNVRKKLAKIFQQVELCKTLLYVSFYVNICTTHFKMAVTGDDDCSTKLRVRVKK